jgi:hypothetical protein
MATLDSPAPGTGGFGQWVCRIWRWVLDLALVLWVARAPVVFTVLGYLILTVTPQAQDLFVEFASNLAMAWQQDGTFWQLLQFAIAQGYILFFLVLLFFIWAMPTHYAARLLLDTDARYRAYAAAHDDAVLRLMEKWTPRLLGLATFVAVLIALRRSDVNLPDLDEKEVTDSLRGYLSYIAVLVVIAAALFLVYTVKRPKNADASRVLRFLKRLNQQLEPVWRRISPTGARAPTQEIEDSRNVGRFLLVVVFIVFGVIFALGPNLAAEVFPRGLAVPVILGGWLPLLAYLSALGRRWHAPLILTLCVVLTILNGVWDNHAVRRINTALSAKIPVEAAPMRLDKAVDLWMSENGCTGRPAACPRPIIVAAAGGASRAGFFTASIVGYLLQEAPDHGLTADDVRKRLFAFSGVSGGSVGAVMLTAALDARKDSSQHPCATTDFKLWWGREIGNWRDCFEALTSGDFLTAVFIGFLINDMASFLQGKDRAALLEDAMARRYANVVTKSDYEQRPACIGLDCPFQMLKPRTGHWIPLLALHGTSEATGQRLITSALAARYTLSSPASCPTQYVAQGKDPGCVLFTDSDHFHDLINDQRPAGDAAAPDDIRLSTAAHNSARFPIISPPGSVHDGRNAIVDRIVDGGYFENYGALGAMEIAQAIRAVAPGLAPFVLVISNDPDDLIDPADENESAAAATRAAVEQKKRAAVNVNEFGRDATTTLKTFIQTRQARGILGMSQLRAKMREALSNCDGSVVHIRVWPQNVANGDGSRPVSMSWWLSTPVQRHLHQQTEAAKGAERNPASGSQNQAGKNQNQNLPRLDAVWRALGSRSACAATAEQK